MYRILIDSCGELTEEMKADGHFVSVPLTLVVGEEHIIDDDSFQQRSFLQKVAAFPGAPKSACPSPEAYLRHMKDDVERIYVVTLSSALSGSCNSARTAAHLLKEEQGQAAPKIHVFDSRSASIGQTLIGMRIADCEQRGLSFEETVAEVEAYIESQHTFFVLESLEALRKNGRLSGIKAAIVSALNIKPVMGSTPAGTIQQLGQGRGMAKAIDRMIACMMEVTANCGERILAISHCNCPERAQALVAKLTQAADFAQVLVLETRGVSSLYASDGGIIMVV